MGPAYTIVTALIKKHEHMKTRKFENIGLKPHAVIRRSFTPGAAAFEFILALKARLLIAAGV